MTIEEAYAAYILRFGVAPGECVPEASEPTAWATGELELLRDMSAQMGYTDNKFSAHTLYDNLVTYANTRRPS